MNVLTVLHLEETEISNREDKMLVQYGNGVISNNYTKEESRIENYYSVYSGLTHCGVCKYCGDSFKTRSPHAKYCSARCKNDAYLQRRKMQKNFERQKVCTVCGKKYVAKKKDSIYCSNACKQKAYRTKKNVTV